MGAIDTASSSSIVFSWVEVPLGKLHWAVLFQLTITISSFTLLILLDPVNAFLTFPHVENWGWKEQVKVFLSSIHSNIHTRVSWITSRWKYILSDQTMWALGPCFLCPCEKHLSISPFDNLGVPDHLLKANLIVFKAWGNSSWGRVTGGLRRTVLEFDLFNLLGRT